MIKNKTKKNKYLAGFTLIELMIATTLFTIIMLMGVGSLIVSSNSSKAAQKLRIAVDNVNFAMESMTRELRMGTIYTCSTTSLSLTDSLLPSDCNDGNIIAFKPQQVGSYPDRVAYKLSNRSDGTNTLQRCESGSSSPCSPIVSEDVDIKTLKFFVKGSSLSDKIQPSARILITGSVKVKEEITSFSLQALASQRSAEK